VLLQYGPDLLSKRKPWLAPENEDQ
jgi:hypothetical protein